MSNNTPKSLRDELGQGYLSLLDSVRHNFEEAAWGREGSGSLATESFYRWASEAEATPLPLDAAELGGGVEISAENWNEFAAWIDGKREAPNDRGVEIEHERNGPEREGPELGD